MCDIYMLPGHPFFLQLAQTSTDRVEESEDVEDESQVSESIRHY